jgi:hypothetical protein
VVPFETEQRLMHEAVFVFFAPFDLNDAVQEIDDLVHSTAPHEGLGPGDGLVSKKDTQLVHFAELHQLGLLDLFKVMNEVTGHGGGVRFGRKQTTNRCGGLE